MGISEPKKVPTRSRIKYRQDQVTILTQYKQNWFDLYRNLTNVSDRLEQLKKTDCYINIEDKLSI